MNKFTKNEINFLALCLNYSDIESQLSDNMSCGGLDDAAGLFDDDRQAGAGLMSSLNNKGAGSYDSNDDLFWLNDDALPAIFAAVYPQ